MKLNPQSAHSLFFRALESGARRTGVTSCEWTISGKCTDPVMVSFQSRPDRPPGHRYVSVPRDGVSYFVDIWTRCRKCDKCLQYRRRLWQDRATAESSFASGRSWFLTLTVNATMRFQAKAQAAVLARKAGIDDLESENLQLQFKYIARVMQPWVTKYLKRVRKQYSTDTYAAKFRYVCVAEPHKNGFPHFHLLIHENSDAEPILHKRLARWSWGFSKAKLVWEGHKAASYIAKYCAKGAHARVRASKHYGRPLQAFLNIVRPQSNVLLHPQLKNPFLRETEHDQRLKCKFAEDGTGLSVRPSWTDNGKRSLFGEPLQRPQITTEQPTGTDAYYWAWEFNDNPERVFVRYDHPPDIPF